MRKKIKKILILSLGIGFILFGLIGLLLPILQGVLFLIMGFLLLSLYFPKIRFYIQKHAKKNKHSLSLVNKAEKWIAKFIGDI